MLKSEMQHQFWITKKTVQRKLGTKEDVHVISSDADLDAKIEIFKSISETSSTLSKLIDQMQEQMCILSHEEAVFGRFLKDAGKRSKTTGTSIANTGKAVSYSGQQRMSVRVPILRLQQEVEVFRYRAVRDTLETIQGMEKDRTEYRAALAWMKAASAELDPDTARGLEKFRVAQSVVRNAKQNFDCSSLNTLQKIDLLAAARCNMFSHALSAYMIELKEFGIKTSSTYESIAQTLELTPKYDFTVLKELTQNEGDDNKKKKVADKNDQKSPLKGSKNIRETKDTDHCMFFAEEFKDDAEEDSQSKEKNNEEEIISLHREEENDTIKDNKGLGLTSAKNDGLLLLPINQNNHDNMPLNGNNFNNNSCDNNWWNLLHENIEQPITMMMSTLKPQLSQKNTIAPDKEETTPNLADNKSKNKQSIISGNNNGGKYNSWLEMFAELDPLANPEAFDFKFNSANKNIQQT